MNKPFSLHSEALPFCTPRSTKVHHRHRKGPLLSSLMCPQPSTGKYSKVLCRRSAKRSQVVKNNPHGHAKPFIGRNTLEVGLSRTELIRGS